MAGRDSEAPKRMGITDPGSTLFSRDELVSMSANPRNQSKPGWFHEDEFHELALQIAVEEKNTYDGKDVSFETFLDGQIIQDIKSALNSVGDFYPDGSDNSTRQNDHHLQQALDEEPPHFSVDERLALTSQTGEQCSLGVDEPDGISTEYPVEEEPRQLPPPTNEAIDESFYDGVFDEYPQPGEAADSWHMDATLSRISLEFLVKRLPTFQLISNLAMNCLMMNEEARDLAKRSHRETLDPDPSRPVKKRRISGNAETPHARKEFSESTQPGTVRRTKLGQYEASPPSSAPKSSAPQQTIRPRAASQMTNGRLNFPVIKDPNDPFNILRFSQGDDSSSKNGLGSSQPVPNSFPSSCSTRSTPGDASEAGLPFNLIRHLPLTVVERRVALDPHVAKVISRLHYSFLFRRLPPCVSSNPLLPGPRKLRQR
ncbi:C4-type zinc-finger of DNA polymerase delta [Penicillium subrubescens]|uniref:C4-type zinc-finger of DNA polymerase delta n=1 Tax=Penicillium subrubescens TaxID=1316194 RepID=UPI0025455073|nr:C4-type zinc-finger of DNA polymerase delta [Penicillium subrubescens]KAJ5873657.1 C4-type zinc-finger of DNA polymerase delta [Penicillium subrubescens]